MSRDANRKSRAADSRLIALDFDRIDRSGGFTLALPMSSSSSTPTETSTTTDARHRPQRGVVADGLEQRGAEEEPDALERVLRAGEDRDQTEQRAPSPATNLTALFELILVRSLAIRTAPGRP
jgi:hypothetical protein